MFFFKQAAVRAMDTIQHFVKAKLGNQVEKFFIAGASKASILYIERRRISPIRAHTKFYCNQMIEMMATVILEIGMMRMRMMMMMSYFYLSERVDNMDNSGCRQKSGCHGTHSIGLIKHG